MLSGYLLRDLVTRSTRSTSPRPTTSTPWRSLRVDAARDARRGRRLRRVLHTAAGHPAHGPAGRPAARRDRPRPGRRDRRIPGRGATSTCAPRANRRREIATQRLSGIEKKPLPYLLGMMNLLLHGVGSPTSSGTTRCLTVRPAQAGVDVVLTNPPFGGEEERASWPNFPADLQTAETAWLFLSS